MLASARWCARWAWAQRRSPPAAAACEAAAFLLLGTAVAGGVTAALAAGLGGSASARPVDRAACDCACWDGAFKNGYNTRGYKTVHFSLDERLLPIAAWAAVWTLAAARLAAAVGAAVVDAALAPRPRGRTPAAGVGGAGLRLPLLFLLAAQVYPHFYAAWTGFNYLNEGIAGFFAVQAVLAASEAAATAAAVAQLSTRVSLSPVALWFIVAVAAVHIVHNVRDRTTSWMAMPIMAGADAAAVAVAAGYLFCLIGTRPLPWFVPLPPLELGDASASGAAATADDDGRDGDDGVGGGKAAAAAAAAVAESAPIYTARRAAIDGAWVIAAIVLSSIALSAWHEEAKTW